MAWTASDIPDLSSKTIVVTGANSGLGFETTRMLAGAGAHVIMACRTAAKAEAAITRLQESNRAARLTFMPLDLANLDSVRAFAKAFDDEYEQLDVLLNNAGVMALPRCETAQGFEMQIGTNHFGHFALTGLLLPRLLATPGSRVVQVSSLMHKMGKMNFDDLHGQRSYDKWRAYAQSKLANLLFCYELDRKLKAAGAEVRSVASHPGYASTNLQTAAAKMEGSKFGERLWNGINAIAAQPAAMGAMPSVYAAVAEGVGSGEFFGPDGIAQARGNPHRVQSNRRSHDPQAAARLWELSVEGTGESFAALNA